MWTANSKATMKPSTLEEGFTDEKQTELPLPLHVRARGWCTDLLRPSFATVSKGRQKQLGRTGYLDGLRGFAAFLVYWGHHHLWARETLGPERIFENGFGYDQQHYFACLPGVRIFFSGGHFAVTVFFVISGYVLSAKPLALIHAGDQVKLSDNLASALFRRWLRLHIPVICTTFLYMTSFHLFGVRGWPDPQPTYADEIWKWYTEIKNFTFVFRTGGEPWFSYNFHTWSIPTEFRGSICVYTALLAFSRCTQKARLWGEVILMYYFMYIVDGWFASAFMAGLFICDIDLLLASGDLEAPKWIMPFSGVIFHAMLIISIYLGGVPSESADVQVLRDTPGWYYLSFLKPQAVYDYKHFFLFWAATLLVVSIPNISWLKKFFEMRFNQYMGKISFAFYLVHGPILWTLGTKLYAATGWAREGATISSSGWTNSFAMPKDGPLGLDVAFWVPQLILLPVTLWLAELATKLFDEPSVRFSQSLYRRATNSPAKY
jgi:peptidoglycan/LPS O-acetylase OafA/YrhL